MVGFPKDTSIEDALDKKPKRQSMWVIKDLGILVALVALAFTIFSISMSYGEDKQSIKSQLDDNKQSVIAVSGRVDSLSNKIDANKSTLDSTAQRVDDIASYFAVPHHTKEKKR